MTTDEIMALADEYAKAQAWIVDILPGEDRIFAMQKIIRAKDALRAAVEQLADAVTWVPVLRERAERAEDAWNAAIEHANHMTGELERAEQEAAELRKDAERYRWLRTRNEGPDGDPNGPYAVNSSMDGYEPDYPTGAELDAAIDAAMKEGK